MNLNQKKMNIDISTKVGEIVKENFRTAQIFDKNKIDFCCGGGISLEKACKKSKVDVARIIPELQSWVVSNDAGSR